MRVQKMPKKRSHRSQQIRYGIAHEAARIMREQGIKDFLLAKRKAAERMGISDRTALPGNDEIAAALTEQQRLFGGSAYPARLRALRETATRAMDLLNEFEPRLVGSVLSGAVTDHSEVNLHVFSDTPEAVAIHLMDCEIPYESSERRIRYPSERTESRPSFRFVAGDVAVEATVFPVHGLRQAPSCPIDGRPMQRARLPELEALLAES
jgi:hypothetical protein